MQSFAASPVASSAVFAPLAAPGAGVAGAAAPDLARRSAAPAPGPSMQFASLQSQDDQLYSSFATKKHKKIAGGEGTLPYCSAVYSSEQARAACRCIGFWAAAGEACALHVLRTLCCGFVAAQSPDCPLGSAISNHLARCISASGCCAAEEQGAWDGSVAPVQQASSAGQAAAESYPRQGVANTASSVPAQQSAPAAYPTQGATSRGSGAPVQQAQYAGTTGTAQAGQGSQAAYPAQAAGTASAGSSAQAQGTQQAASAAFPMQGAGTVSSGSSVQASPSLRQGANAVNAGSNVPAQSGQAASAVRAL